MYRNLLGYFLHVINWLADNVCMEKRSRVGRGSALHGQFNWKKHLVGEFSLLKLRDSNALLLAAC